MTREELAQKVAGCLIYEGYGADIWRRRGDVRVYVRATLKHLTRPISLGYIVIGDRCELDGSSLNRDREEEIMQVVFHLKRYEIPP